MAKFRPERRKSPCSQCPFRRNSVRGYLGADDPEHFLSLTMRDATMPCHMDIDYSDKDWLTTQEPDAPLCVGALQFQNNFMKLARDPEVARGQRAVGESANVFSNPEEFLVHHMFGRWAGKVKDSFWWMAEKVNRAMGYED